MAYYGNYYRQDTIDELIDKNRTKFKRYQKKNPECQPVIINNGTICSSWWGKSWNKNFKRYADYSSRISRGSRYIKGNCIFDLRIEGQDIYGVIAGSGRKLYDCHISIDKMAQSDWDYIVQACGRQFDGLEELLDGKFPKTLKDLFFDSDRGLFPTPKQIHMDCSCPDWAVLCKHISAILYGVSNRLDDHPELLFQLRGVDLNNLVSESLGSNLDNLMDKANCKSKRILKNKDIDKIFNL